MPSHTHHWVFWLHLPSSSLALICFYEGTMASFSRLPSLSVQLSLSPLVFLSLSPSSECRFSDHRVWSRAGGELIIMEKRTRHGGNEGGKRDRESGGGENETDRCRRRAALLFISRRKTKKKTKKETHREVKSSFPMLYLHFKGLVGSWGISQHALGTRQGKIFGSDPPDLVDLVITTEMQPP